MVTYNRAAGSLATVPLSGDGEIVATGTPATVGDGCVNAPAPGSLLGKIALIRRGSAAPPAPTCGFYNKAINAQNAGAIAIVIYNNVAGALNPTVAPVPAGAPPVNIPVAAITAADGAAIFSNLATDHTLTWTDQVLETPLATAGLISDFSSFGTDAELGLKPDLGGPGGQIYSTWPHQQFGGHNTISGTSMSSPHVAGLAALLLEAKHNSISPAMVQTLLMNTALPKGVNIAPTAGLEPTWRQGAGLAQIVEAVTTPASVTPAKISLGEGNGGSSNLTVSNTSSAPITYNLSALTTVGTGPSTAAGAVYPFNFSYLLGSNTATFSSPSVTVPAGGTASVRVTIQAGAWPDKSLYGGYVVLTPQGGGITLRVPYLGFMGDYQSLPVLTGAGCGLPAVFKVTAGGTDCVGNGVSRLGSRGGDLHPARRRLPDPALPSEPPGAEAEHPGLQGQRLPRPSGVQLRIAGRLPRAQLRSDHLLRVRLERHPLAGQRRRKRRPSQGRAERSLRIEAERPEGPRQCEQRCGLGDLHDATDHARPALGQAELRRGPRLRGPLRVLLSLPR